MRLIVFMEPEPKARARTIRMKSGAVGSYTPSKTVKAESMIRAAFMDSGLTKFAPKTPLKMRVIAYRSRPKSLPKMVTFPVTRPDADNYAKLVLDALNKFAFEDDSQIIELVCEKRFGDPPRVEIEIEEILTVGVIG